MLCNGNVDAMTKKGELVGLVDLVHNHEENELDGEDGKELVEPSKEYVIEAAGTADAVH